MHLFPLCNMYFPSLTVVLLSAALYTGVSVQTGICPPMYRTIGSTCANDGQGACSQGGHVDVVSRAELYDSSLRS